jgi:hypothetical protein
MIVFVFRWVFPAVGLLFLTIGLIGAPGRGSPPLASLWGGRAEAVVTAARIVEDDPLQNWPYTQVSVAWPPGSSRTAVVGALTERARPSQRAVLEPVVARFPAGTRITVRVAGGRPYADVTDVFALLWTIGAVLLGGLVAAIGVVLNRALR